MRKYAVVLMAIFFLGEACGAPAQVTILGPRRGDVPAVITAGMDAYSIKGADEAVKVWVRNGPLDGDKSALSQANVLRQIQDYYGAYQSFDLIAAYDLTQRVRLVYVVMNFEKGPVFGKFICYRSDREWMVTNFVLNTKDTEVLPTEVTLANH